MRHVRLSGVAILGLCLTAGAPAQATNWIGADGVKVMPRSGDVRLRVGTEPIACIQKIHWPTKAKKENGSWLWIEDDGSSGKAPVAGWLNKGEVVEIDKALDHYNKQLVESPKDPVYLWLRGIYWEEQKEPLIALDDYTHAIEHDPCTGKDCVKVPDARLGAARASGDLAKFADAESLNCCVPRFYLDWGKAFEVKGGDGYFKCARDKYERATCANPHWAPPYLALGKLLVEHPGATNEPTQWDRSLRTAQALDPGAKDIYFSRAKSLIKEGKYAKALPLATKACQLSSFRNADCLDQLAQTYYCILLKDADCKKYPGTCCEKKLMEEAPPASSPSEQKTSAEEPLASQAPDATVAPAAQTPNPQAGPADAANESTPSNAKLTDSEPKVVKTNRPFLRSAVLYKGLAMQYSTDITQKICLWKHFSAWTAELNGVSVEGLEAVDRGTGMEPIDLPDLGPFSK